MLCCNLFRYGFNSIGHEEVYLKLKKLRENNYKGIIGVNLGKNKDSSDAIEDYVKGVKLFCDVADYLVINISRFTNVNLKVTFEFIIIVIEQKSIKTF